MRKMSRAFGPAAFQALIIWVRTVAVAVPSSTIFAVRPRALACFCESSSPSRHPRAPLSRSRSFRRQRLVMFEMTFGEAHRPVLAISKGEVPSR